MEDQCSSLSWANCYQEEGMEELKHTLLLTTLELETTLMAAKEEITRREFELVQLKDVLSKTLKERDEARDRFRKLTMEQFMLLQQQQQLVQETASISGVSSSEDDESKPAGDSNKLVSSSDSKGSMISSPSFESISALAPVNPPPSQPPQSSTVEVLKLAANRPLPVKGKLLQAVKDAGPLLHNLLLAGPLPHWQHPPPQLTSVDIPPVVISSPTQQLINQDSLNNLNGCLSKKRGLESYGASDSSPKSKNQKACSPLNKANNTSLNF